MDNRNEQPIMGDFWWRQLYKQLATRYTSILRNYDIRNYGNGTDAADTAEQIEHFFLAVESVLRRPTKEYRHERCSHLVGLLVSMFEEIVRRSTDTVHPDAKTAYTRDGMEYNLFKRFACFSHWRKCLEVIGRLGRYGYRDDLRARQEDWARIYNGVAQYSRSLPADAVDGQRFAPTLHHVLTKLTSELSASHVATLADNLQSA